MTEAGPQCGRERDDSGVFMALLACPGEDDPVCFVVASAYQRGRRDGIDEGVQIAKDRLNIYYEEVDWVAVDAEAERAKEQTR